MLRGEFEAYCRCLERLGIKATENVLVAELGEKKLCLWRRTELLTRYPVSFSKRERSCREGSLGTPWGLHEIASRHGQTAPPGMMFVGREATGQCWQDLPDAGQGQPCQVTTRILRLRGLEAGLNAGPGRDSCDRYIYIHGTNHPEVFPENISSGCLLMLDDDLIDLFAKVEVGTHVWVSHP